MMRNIAILCASALLWVPTLAADKSYTFPVGDGTVALTPYAGGAVRVQVAPAAKPFDTAADIFYVGSEGVAFDTFNVTGQGAVATLGGYTYTFNGDDMTLAVVDENGCETVCCHITEIPGDAAAIKIHTDPREMICGTGQFQDGHLYINDVTRRLTQVNTQIALPMVMSNFGYGLLWNNTGLTDFNPSDFVVNLVQNDGTGESEEVDATGTSGNKREQRNFANFSAEIDVPENGKYSLLLDVGQQMARRHQMSVDGDIVCDARNVWLPPTNSVVVELTKGKHLIEVVGELSDRPTVGVHRIDNNMVFSSPVADIVDFTIFTGNADSIVGQYRAATGQAPKMPAWGLGYIHCRERYVSQDDLLANATEFRRRDIPIDMIVQDWQYWGKYGWNAMRFDEKYYPDPKAMTDSLHDMDMRLMVSVWAKVDRNSELGKKMAANGCYIDDNCEWIDFFNPKAANAYVKAYDNYLLPAGIDAWWQDATEPENDDLHGRRVNDGTVNGDIYRNIFALVVNDNVYKGLCAANPDKRQMILTRSGAPGIQRYGVTTWSGDVGNDWQTLRYQLNGGMGQMAAGVPWWTYDAGGFFRPGNQYTDDDYQKRMLRWIETSVFLPLMRVHGYMSMTEPWCYSDATCNAFVKNIQLRYSLLPYIYSEAMRVSTEGNTLMRPLIFDFPHDRQALICTGRESTYMFGPAFLVSPVLQPNVDTWATYLPDTQGGWYALASGQHYDGGQHARVPVTDDAIPVYVRAGSIVPRRDVEGVRSSVDALNAPQLQICVYPGADGKFTLWEDDGVSQSDDHSEITFTWNDAKRSLEISPRKGAFKDMPKKRTFTIALPDGTSKTVNYKGKKVNVKL